MAGWFSNTNVDDIPDNPNELPNNTYKFRVTAAKVAETKPKAGQTNFVPKTGITFKYQIVEGAWSTFFPISDWVRVPDDNTKPDEVDRILSYLKMRLLAFGFSPEEIAKFGPEVDEEEGVEITPNDCINREFWGTTFSKTENGRTNTRINKFDLIEEDGGWDPGSEDEM